ncbi:MAG: type I 3-dehydroquinate dehydratase [Phycisphaerales bacterium]|nr:type I 3-dehydroquinate dehydratase [Phycisphaerales bacterium]
MTLLCVPIPVHAIDEVPSLLTRCAQAAERGANIVEWRIDELFAQPFDSEGEYEAALDAIAQLIRDSVLPSLVTARTLQEGGRCELDADALFHLLSEIASLQTPPRFVDVEFALVEKLARIPTVREGGASLLFSAHDFQGPPAHLARLYARMASDDRCAIAKIAWRARSVRDCHDVFELLALRAKPSILLCMGDEGLATRVLAPKFGAFLTFASEGDGLESAPGQPTINTLKERYRFDAISRATKVYAVIGFPIAHSKSPAFHNARFAEAGHDGVLLPLLVRSDWESFKATLAMLLDDASLSFRGASVTLPHKEHLVRFVQERGGVVDDMTARLGASNTLVVRADGSLFATNTDRIAACSVLADAFAAPLRGKRIAVFGAGGVARAIAGGLAVEGARVVVVNRTHEKAVELARELSTALGVQIAAMRESEFDCNAAQCERFDGFVNATPVGMEGGSDPDGFVLPDAAHLESDTVVFDTVYAPRDTPLLKFARSRGARTVDGYAMFVKQAELQSRLWLESL